MAIEFNGRKGNVENLRIGKDAQNAKNVQKEEQIVEQKQVADNKFVKELGADLLTSTAASAYGINFTKTAGTKIDKEFWGDALNGLKLKDTAIAEDTTKGIAELGTTFAMLDMEAKMAKSPFIQALNKEFGIS